MTEAVPGAQLDRFCASGLEAVNIAAAKVGSDQADMVVAGGVELSGARDVGIDRPRTRRTLGQLAARGDQCGENEQQERAKGGGLHGTTAAVRMG